ncbi:hypothetical protein [Mycobacterium malmoense]|uniref:hypothetical protein n=1 Tax=Mycobacterium malmoense TaxID=1780 RepID=UPI0008F88273|nr:hypothetical protein [Mycobacterium malmoense]OIN82530.1 hypothetical protein BMG05_01965 [Mycobacterium malmoense]
MSAQRRAALERAGWVLEILDELELADVADSIPGASAIGAAAILAETMRWSSMPGYARARTTAAPVLAAHGSAGMAGLGCG